MIFDHDAHREVGEEDFTSTMALRRAVSEGQYRTFEGYAAEMFTAFGLDLTTPATVDTPRRFVRAFFDATTFWRGRYDEDPTLRAEFFTACGLQR